MATRPPRLDLDVRSDATAHVVRVEGELDLETRDQLQAVLDELGRPPDVVALDFSAVRFIDSTGLKTILDEHHRARREGYTFVIVGAGPSLRTTFRLTALDLTLPLAEDLESALR